VQKRDSFANQPFCVYAIETKSLTAAQAFIYRAIDNTCQASASGVSLPVQMAVVTDESAQRLGTADFAPSKNS